MSWRRRQGGLDWPGRRVGESSSPWILECCSKPSKSRIGRQTDNGGSAERVPRYGTYGMVWYGMVTRGRQTGKVGQFGVCFSYFLLLGQA